MLFIIYIDKKKSGAKFEMKCLFKTYRANRARTAPGLGLGQRLLAQVSMLLTRQASSAS